MDGPGALPEESVWRCVQAAPLALLALLGVGSAATAVAVSRCVGSGCGSVCACPNVGCPCIFLWPDSECA